MQKNIVLLFVGVAILMSVRHAAAQETPEAENPFTAHARANEASQLAIFLALSEPANFDYDDPLGKVIEFMEQDLDVPIRLDTQRLDELDLGSDSPVKIKTQGTTARSALNLMLRQIDPELTWSIQQQVLMITTKEMAAENLITRIYDVHDLVVFVDAAGNQHADFDQLIDLITQTVRDDTWLDAGGEGTIAEFTATGIDALVVTQIWPVHEQVTLMLAKLRAIRDPKVYQDGKLQVRSRRPSASQLADNDELRHGTPLSPVDDSEHRDFAARGSNQLGFDLYRQLTKDADGNVVFSPISISMALAMVSAGAQGETKAELAELLHCDLEENQRHVAYGALLNSLNQIDQSAGLELRVANRLWVQENYPIEPLFAHRTEKIYGALSEPIDFEKTTAALKRINGWVAEQTNNQISNLLGPGAIDDATRLVLANATYFNGVWDSPFEVHATREAKFRNGKEELTVAMMHQTEMLPYAEVDGVQIVSKPYFQPQLRMLVLLPRGGPSELANLEAALSDEKLAEWNQQLKPTDVDLALPRFSMRTTTDLPQVLTALGAEELFSSLPNLSGISNEPGLFLQTALHEAMIETDERGTEAAAATVFGGGGGFGAAEKPKPVEFRADHPFLVAIRDDRTGAILFLARVSEPEAWKEPELF